jgi:peptidoglycan biosynthesis protein MviN/MurJ (putative lipid II flippase)
MLLHDTKTPVIVGFLPMSLNIGFSLLFYHNVPAWTVDSPRRAGPGHSLATGIEMAILLVIMRKTLNGLQGLFILDAVWKGAAAWPL